MILFVILILLKVDCLVCGDTGSLGAKYRAGYCYALSQSSGDGQDTPANHATWCKNNFHTNATLPVIHSKSDEDWLHDWIGLSFRLALGLYDNTVGCDWDGGMIWADGSYADYRPAVNCWDQSGGNRDCMYIANSPTLDWCNWWDCGYTVAKSVCQYKLNCHGKWSGDTEVCSGNGICRHEDDCTCDEGYFGKECEVIRCYGNYSNTTAVCSGKGNCTAPDACECELGYAGKECDTKLDGLCEESEDRFNGYCYKNFGSGRNFDAAETYCENWVGSVPSHLVSIHYSEEEKWVNKNIKGENDVWVGLKKYDDIPKNPCPTVWGYVWTDGTNDSYAKSKIVSCGSNDLCIGWTNGTGWEDISCSETSYDTTCKYQIPTCNGIPSHEFREVCSGRGRCLNLNNCSCVEDYFGENCELWKCFGEFSNDKNEVCTGHGTCKSTDNCKCDAGYVGETCNITVCDGIRSDDGLVCNSRGECLAPNKCGCNLGFAGDDCEYQRTCSLSGDVKLGEYCYARFRRTHELGQGLQYEPSEEHCQNVWANGLPDGHLISIWSEEEKNLFEGMVTGGCTWIGLRKKRSTTDCHNTSNVEWKDGSTNFTYFLDPAKVSFSCGNAAEYGIYFDNTPDDYQDRGETDLCDLVCKRPIPVCFGVNGDSSSVCSEKGVCFENDTCKCFNPFDYFGKKCNITTCDFIRSDQKNKVCAGRGSCWPKDECDCDSGYFGEFCKVTTCFGVLSNETITPACNGHGTCWPEDKCTCEPGFFGANCSITECNGILSNMSKVICHGHGSCVNKDQCTCSPSDEYYGKDCEYSFCYGISSTSSSPRPCSARGTCYPFNKCNCDAHYYGEHCNITVCNGWLSNSSEVCFQGKGTCWPREICSCVGPPYLGQYCELAHPCHSPGEKARDGHCYKNFGVIGDWNASESRCNKWFFGGHLVSIGSSSERNWVSNQLITKNIFTGALKKRGVEKKLYPCALPLGYAWSDGSSDSFIDGLGSNVNCTTNHSCIMMKKSSEFEDVDCKEDFVLESGCKYKIPICFGVSGNETSKVCTNHGYCFENDNCTCFDDNGFINTGKYDGLNCNQTFCNKVHSNSPNVCGGHGVCWPYEKCRCKDNFFGEYCEVTTCYGVFSNDTNVCNGLTVAAEKCWDLNKCRCKENYYGSICNVTVCNSVFSNESNVCLGHGRTNLPCWPNEKCNCIDGWRKNNCQEPRCFGIWADEVSEVCTKNLGTCSSLDHCDCHDKTKYFGSNCNITKCFDFFSNVSLAACNGHGDCWPYNTCNCTETEGYFGQNCGEFINPLISPELNVNSSTMFFPYRVHINVVSLFRRSIQDRLSFPCGERIANYLDYAGEAVEYEIKCWWVVNGSDNNGSFTKGFIYQMNDGENKLYKKVPDGQTIKYPFQFKLLTIDRNYTYIFSRSGAEIVVPPKPDDEDDNGGEDDDDGGVIGGIVAGTVVTSLTAGIIVAIVFGGICASCCLCCLTCIFALFLVVLLFVLFCVVISVACCFCVGFVAIFAVFICIAACTGTLGGGGVVAGTTGTVAGAYVATEVAKEVLEEEPDAVTQYYKEKRENKQSGWIEGEKDMNLDEGLEGASSSDDDTPLGIQKAEVIEGSDGEDGLDLGLDSSEEEEEAKKNPTEIELKEIEVKSKLQDSLRMTDRKWKEKEEKVKEGLDLQLDTKFAKKKRKKAEKQIEKLKKKAEKEKKKEKKKAEKEIKKLKKQENELQMMEEQLEDDCEIDLL